MPTYQITMILRPSLQKETITKTIKKMAHVICPSGGVIQTVKNGGVRYLCDSMSRHGRRFREGLYLLATVDARPEVLRGVEKQMGEDESVLRWKSIKVFKVTKVQKFSSSETGSASSQKNFREG
ncbi:28S ribosomal protein S6, mitochondrial [Bonamia ostreae]|uniref:28S ribosomal protein S6, mitochondrial n=1 Tax=Bonamia ostreae TaxID=126728 RepID=A0ABV2AQL8_9EUKA